MCRRVFIYYFEVKAIKDATYRKANSNVERQVIWPMLMDPEVLAKVAPGISKLGGELIEIQFKKRKHNRPKLVMLSNVSRSMDLYATFLFQFMLAFQHVYRKIETLTFSTSLQHITPVLKQPNFSTTLTSIKQCKQ